METELLQQTKRHFSKLGLMYFLGTLIIVSVQSLSAILAVFISPDIMENNNMYLLITMLPMYLIAVPLMVLLIKRVPGKTIVQHKMTVGQWLIAFIMCYAILYASNIVGQIISTVIGILKGSMVSNTVADIVIGTSPWMTFFIMVLCAPVMEEILFRKLLIERTVRYGEGTAIVISGLMFGLFHGNLNQFAYAFTLGMFLGFIYVKTGKLIYVILLHMIINFMGSVLGLLILDMSGYQELVQILNSSSITMGDIMEYLPALMLLLSYGFALITLTVSGVVLLIIKRKRFTCRPGEISIPKGRRFSITILNLGMLIFSIFWIVQIILQLL